MTSSSFDVDRNASDSLPEELERALSRVLRSLVFRNNPNSPLIELPIAQMRCLHAIAGHEDQKMIELAEKLEVQLPAMSQIVDRLVKRGLVERHADPSDRRVVRLGLTETARGLLDESRAAREARLDATVRNLDDASLSKVVEGLRLLAGAAERADEENRRVPPPAAQDADPLVEMMARRARTRCARSAAKRKVPVPGRERTL